MPDDAAATPAVKRQWNPESSLYALTQKGKPHGNQYVPYYKSDENIAYFFRANPARFKDSNRTLTTGEREEALTCLYGTVRPRLASDRQGCDSLRRSASNPLAATTYRELGSGSVVMGGTASSGLNRTPSSPSGIRGGRAGASGPTEGGPAPRLGATVQIKGLTGRAELNDAFGEVVDDVPDVDGRLHIRLSSAGAGSVSGAFGKKAKVMRIHPGRLSSVEDSAEAEKAAFRTSSMSWAKADGPSERGRLPIHRNRRGFERLKGGYMLSPSLNGV